MPSYFGVKTQQNKVLWALFICCFIAGAVMLPLGWAKLTPCIRAYNDCIRKSAIDAYIVYCNNQKTSCEGQWTSVWIAGVFLLGFSVVFLCIFSFCSRPPLPYCDAAVPAAVALQHYPQGAYQPYPPAPGTYYGVDAVTGQPVVHVGVPQNGQPGVYYYPAAPPPAGVYQVPSAPVDGAVLYGAPPPPAAVGTAVYQPPPPPPPGGSAPYQAGLASPYPPAASPPAAGASPYPPPPARV